MYTRRIRTLKYRGFFVIMGTSLFLTQMVSGVSWTRTYGGPEYDAGYSVLQTQDGGYLVAGVTRSYGMGNRDVWIIRTDSLGNTLWTRTYGGSENDVSIYIISTSDGHYLVVGATDSYGVGWTDAWLLKIDASGDTLWTRTYGGSGVDYLMCIVETPNNGYFMVGVQLGEYTTDLWLIRTDSLGDTLWTRTYRMESDSLCAGRYIIPTRDGNWLILGERGHWPMSIWLLKVDSLGDTLWTQTYGGETSSDIGLGIVETEDGGYLIVGRTTELIGLDTDLWLIKTDSLGDTLWTRIYGNELHHESGHSIISTEDGYYLIVGATDIVYLSDIWLIKVNASGDTVWTRTYGGTRDDWGHRVRQTFDRGYIIVGYTDSYGEGKEDIWLIKTDSLGYVGIEEREELKNCELRIYPNPFREETVISMQYAVGSREKLLTPYSLLPTITIYDLAGRLVRTLPITDYLSPITEITWDGRDLRGNRVRSGIYFIKLTMGGSSFTQKVICIY